MPAVKPVTVLLAPVPDIPPGLMIQLPAGKPLNTTLPVETAQVGWVTAPTNGAAGVIPAVLMYHVCFSESFVEEDIVKFLLTAGELGTIGSALFFSYAIGKLVNGFFSDRININRFIAFGLLATALCNLAMGLFPNFIAFVILWGLSGWFQSQGAAPCAVALTRWFKVSERGTYYGIWSASHNISKGSTSSERGSTSSE